MPLSPAAGAAAAAGGGAAAVRVAMRGVHGVDSGGAAFGVACRNQAVGVVKNVHSYGEARWGPGNRGQLVGVRVRRLLRAMLLQPQHTQDHTPQATDVCAGHV